MRVTVRGGLASAAKATRQKPAERRGNDAQRNSPGDRRWERDRAGDGRSEPPSRAPRSRSSTAPPTTPPRPPGSSSEAGGRAVAYPCDVGDDAAVGQTRCNASARELGRVTGVVTAAGIFHGPDLQPAHQVTVDDFVHVLRVNLVGTFAVIKHALPMLIDGGGAIVTIASTAAIRGHGYGAGYTASKGGVDALHAIARGAVRRERRARELHLSRAVSTHR